MFTGLVQDIGTLEQVRHGSGGATLRISSAFDVADLDLGESIAVSGVCLTVTGTWDGGFDADASPETMARSTLGELRPGARVHLERALRVGDRLGGHFVSGHVDATGRVTSSNRKGNSVVVRFAVDSSIDRYLVEKGSVCVDGVSLTINGVGSGWFELAIIPHTATATRLSDLRTGDRVNVEVDILGKYVESLLGAGTNLPANSKDREAEKSGISLEMLTAQGYVRK